MTPRRWGFVGAVVSVVLVAMVAGLGLWTYFARPITLPAPRETAAPIATSHAAFVGAERCANCHTAQFAAWKQSTHGRAGGPPSPELVIAPFGGAPIRFANAEVTPRVRGAAYTFVVEQRGEPRRVLRVDGVIGGGHIYGGGTQGFVTTLDDGTVRFLPFEWSRHNRAWFCNTNSRSGRGWTPITPTMRIEECGDWPPVRVLGDVPRYANCQSCHASQASVAIDSAAHKYHTNFTSLAINCESCHGAGARHVELAERGAMGSSSDVGFASLATLDKDASLRVCYQCHAVKDHLRDGFLSGDSLAGYYSLKFPLLGDRPLYPDGRIRTFAYQEGHSFSDCYLNGGMTCASCHDPHNQQYRDVVGTPLQGRFNDQQCTSCHLSKADRVVEHTKHRTAPSCTSCHMPSRQEADTRALSARYANAAVVAYARSDHTISIPRPALDSALGLTSACATCHASMSTAQQEAQIRAWWGEVKPLNPVVAAQFRVSRQLDASAAAPLLLGDARQDSASSHPYARFNGVSLFLDAYVTPDMEIAPDVRQRLRELASSRDEDVRAAALATLHLANGDDRTVRRTLAAALRAEGARDAALRSRWSLALGYMGDRYAAQGSLTTAITAFNRALEVQPSSARLLASLANAQRDAGDLTSAVATYQRSIAIDHKVPLTWVNLGLVLGSLGDTVAAVRALTHATTLDASEPLAWFNLGNIFFVRGDLTRAAAMYEKAAALDPSIALAHFQLARVSLLRKDDRSALANLRRGLAFDSSDASAREMADALSKRLGSGLGQRR